VEYVKKDGIYYLDRDGLQTKIGETVAVCFEKAEGRESVLLRHGAPKMVSDYVRHYKQSLESLRLTEISDRIHVLEGKIDLEVLNKIIGITGYVGRYYESVKVDTSQEGNTLSIG